MRYLVQEAAEPDLCGEEHEPTDLYCAPLRQARVRYPLMLTVGLIATGVVAVLMAGFVGYYYCSSLLQIGGVLYCNANGFRTDPWYHFLYLSEPWPLYLWFSGIMVLLQVSILRSAALRRRLIATLIVTLLSIGVVAYVYLYGGGQLRILLLGLLYNPWTYTVANFGLILAFVIDSGRRWLGYRTTELNAPWLRELQIADPNRSLRIRRAQIGELISGDLIAGMLLSAVLALVFTEAFLGRFFGLAGANTFACGATPFAPHTPYSTLQDLHLNLNQFLQMLKDKTYTKPYFPCPISAPGGPLALTRDNDPVFGISRIDQILAGICFVPGMAVLAITAFESGLEPLMRRDRPAASPGGVAPDQSATGPSVTIQVSQSVLDALRVAIERYILPYARRAALSLRNIFWPVLILVGSFSFALCARFFQYYLHHYDPTNNCSSGQLPGCQPADIRTYVVLAAVFGLVGLLSTVVSVALFLPSGRVVTNSFRFLGRIGFVLLLTFWMFSLALFGFNWLLVDTGVVPRSLTLSLTAQGDGGLCSGPSWQIMLAPPHPACSQPFGLSWLSAISFAALILALVFLVLRVRVGYFAARASRAREMASPGASGIRSLGG